MSRGLTPEDIAHFLDGTLADERLPDVLDAIEEHDPQVEMWLDFLDLPEPNGVLDANVEIPKAVPLTELLAARSDALRRSVLWTFEWENPLARFAADGTGVKTTLVGRMNGTEWRGDCVLEPLGDDPRSFRLRIDNLPAGCEPLCFANIAARAPASLTVAPAWPHPVIEAVRHDSSARPTRLAFDDRGSSTETSAESKDFWFELIPGTTRLTVQAERRGGCRADVVIIELRPVGHEGHPPVLQRLTLDRVRRGRPPQQVLEAELDLAHIDFGPTPPARVDVTLRGLAPAELRQLAPPELADVLSDQSHSAVSLERTPNGYQGRLLNCDVAALTADRSTIGGLRMVLLESEVS